MEQEVKSSSKGGHRMYSSSRENFWVLQPVFHSSEEGWGVVSHFRSSPLKQVSEEIQVQDVDNPFNRVSNKVRGKRSEETGQPLSHYQGYM